MSVALLDVNVLVALFDPAHPNHEDAHLWFGRGRKRGWATCPITVNGCIRVLSNPAYPTVDASPADVASRLRALCASPDHTFWSDSVSLLDETLFRPRMMTGHQKITDVYLLGLAVRHGGRLATFDRSIPVKAVVGATPSDLEVLGARRPNPSPSASPHF
jgi:toxin-antitoxin system PIN domain toxin